MVSEGGGKGQRNNGLGERQQSPLDERNDQSYVWGRRVGKSPRKERLYQTAVEEA